MTRSGHEIARSRDREIRTNLLGWFAREKRQLPWRGTRDPYRIWISEVMLQQTTVAAVRPRYREFLRRFPNVDALARAREETVLAAWSGLGYYARARNLRRAARRLMEAHGGRLPSDPRELQKLPGFGPYTAAAVAALAYGERTPAAEANVTRVLSRVFLLNGSARDPAHRRAVLARVDALYPDTRPGDLLAALMDLGQLICLPRDPRCGICPLRRECAARRGGNPQAYPKPRRRPDAVLVHVATALLATPGRALLRRRRSTYLDGLWEFPSREGRTPTEARTRLARELGPLGWRIGKTPVGRARHSVVNRRLRIDVFGGSRPDERKAAPAPEGFRWFCRRDLDRAAVPTLTRRIAAAAGFLAAGDRRILLSRAPQLDRPGSGPRADGNRSAHADDPEERDRLPTERPAADIRRTSRVHDRRRQGVLAAGSRGAVDRNGAGADTDRAPPEPAGLARAGSHRPPAARAPG